MAQWGYHRPQRLGLVVFNSYRRYRFLDLHSGLKFNLAQGTVSSFAGYGVLREPTVRLPVHILEVKGGVVSFPRRLRPLERYLSAWTSFSKYVACLEQQLGRQGPLVWPSPGNGPHRFQNIKVQDTYGLVGGTTAQPSL